MSTQLCLILNFRRRFGVLYHLTVRNYLILPSANSFLNTVHSIALRDTPLTIPVYIKAAFRQYNSCVSLSYAILSDGPEKFLVVVCIRLFKISR